MTAPTPGRVLRLAVLAWGLGDLALGRTSVGIAWLVAEAALLAALAAATTLFADTSWYLLPFLLGMAFIAAWAAQAVAAYRRARRLQGAISPPPSRSPAATVAWLTVPLLLWGTGFWLVAAQAATPAAVVDRFVSRWAETDATAAERYAALAEDPAALDVQARAALDRLRELCQAGDLPEDCSTATQNLLRDVRVRIERRGETRAVATAEVVRFERRPSTFLGLLQTSELVPVVIERILDLELEAGEATLGATRWTIVNAEGG